MSQLPRSLSSYLEKCNSIPENYHMVKCSQITGRNSNNLRYADDTTLMAESKEELKSLLMKMKEESEKAGIKPNIQNAKIMASSPITSWQIDEEKNGNSVRFYFLGSRITVDSDCSHEIKRYLLLGRKSMTNLDNILKSRDITFADKGPYSQSYSFSSIYMDVRVGS